MIARGAALPPDVELAIYMCAIDPTLGGIIVRGEGGDRVAAALIEAMPAGARVRRLPVNATDEQIEGGIDLAGALGGSSLQHRAGLLAGGGLLVVPMADRMSSAMAARIAVAMDRDRLLVVALEDDRGDGEVPAALADRLAFRLDLAADEPVGEPAAAPPPEDAAPLLAGIAAALGVGSVRGDLLAWRAACALATRALRPVPDASDVATAARLVLAPRATRLPALPEAVEPPPSEAAQSSPAEGEAKGQAEELADRILAATAAAIDPDLLANLDAGRGRRGQAPQARGAGERRRGLARGRPIGTRPGDPRHGARLALVETLRTAAPWQRLRGRTDRLLVHKADLRIQRREARAETVTIFAVDASGSAAAARLGEAKGAIELLLGQVYVQRAEVALTAFRGAGAELLLPPTKSLTRARRSLAELPGGGGTPLASGITAALGVALSVRAKGRTPMVVVLSDGRANIGAAGVSTGREAAQRDALAAARGIAAERVAAIFVDTGARPRPEGAAVAAAMGARYVPLPYAGPAALQAVIRAHVPA